MDDPDGVMFRAFDGVNADASEGMSVAADSAIYDDDDSLRDWVALRAPAAECLYS